MGERRELCKDDLDTEVIPFKDNWYHNAVAPWYSGDAMGKYMVNKACKQMTTVIMNKNLSSLLMCIRVRSRTRMVN